MGVVEFSWASFFAEGPFAARKKRGREGYDGPPFLANWRISSGGIACIAPPRV